MRDKRVESAEYCFPKKECHMTIELNIKGDNNRILRLRKQADGALQIQVTGEKPIMVSGDEAKRALFALYPNVRLLSR